MARVRNVLGTSVLTKFHKTAIENSVNLEIPYKKQESVEGFLLSEDVRIPLHSCSIKDPDSHLLYNYDLDGIVIQLKSVMAIYRGLHYLKLPDISHGDLVLHYQFLKKHVNFAEYSTRGVKAFQHCFGRTIAIMDDGYFLNLTALPKDKGNPSVLLEEYGSYKDIAVAIINEVSLNFREQLWAMSDKDMKRPTMVKQCLSKTGNFHILQQDLQFVMTLVQRAIQNANDSDEYVTLVPTVTQFGQKQDSPLYLDFLRSEEIECLTLHVACSIIHRDPDVHLFWSRNGLQKLVGTSCNMYSILGMHEAVNVQTRLNKRSLDLHQPLLDVFARTPVRFVQLYVESPHHHFDAKHVHPISGLISLCNLQHHHVKSAMSRAADEYMERLQDLCIKMKGQFSLRLEYVTCLDHSWGIPQCLRAEDYINTPALENIFEMYPAVVPFMDSDDFKVVEVLKDILNYFVCTLG